MKCEIKTVEIVGEPAAQKTGENLGPFETALTAWCVQGWRPFSVMPCREQSVGYLVTMWREVK